MTTYFQGAEKEDFLVTGTVTNPTTVNTFNSSNARASMLPATSGASESNNILTANMSAADDDIWLHFTLWAPAISTFRNELRWIRFLSGSTVLLGFQYGTTGNGTFRVQKFASAAWSTLETSSLELITTTRYVFDVHVVMGNPGTLRVYVDGVPVIARDDLDLTWAGITGIDKVIFGCSNGSTSATHNYSEVIVADWNTIGSKLVTRAPDANGTYTAWAGAGYTALNEITPAATYMTSGTVDQRISLFLSDFPALATNERIESVKTSIAALRDASGPQSANLFVRVNSADDDEADQALSVGILNYHATWEMSPDTATYWTVAELNASEFGVRSRT